MSDENMLFATEDEQEEMEKQTAPKKEPKPRREKLSGDGVLVRSLKVLARACRWCRSMSAASSTCADRPSH